jgi:competence protein ComEC
MIIESFDIGKVYMPKASSNTKTYKDVLDVIKAKGLKITNPVPGSGFKLGDSSVEIYAPNSSKYEDANNYSIVMKLKYGNTSYLFTGDAENISEGEMIGKGFDISANLMKLGHHGSNSSTSEEFLDRVSPEYAVISVGTDNDYGHPTKATMDKLKKRNIPVYRTDENGTIVITSDGDSITFNTKPGSYSYANPKN